MPTPWSPLNDLSFRVQPKWFNPATRKTEILATGAFTGFIAVTDQPDGAAIDAALSVALVYSTVDKRWLGQIDGSDVTAALARRFFSGFNPLAGFLDAFTRANSALTLGVPWTVQGAGQGAAWGIESNAAYSVTEDAESRRVATIDAATANVRVRITIGAFTSAPAIAFRYVDLDHYWYLAPNADTARLEIWEVDGDNATRWASTWYTPLVGDVLEVTAVDGVYGARVERDGAQLCTCAYTDAGYTPDEYATATRHGLIANDGATRFLDFACDPAETLNPYLVAAHAGGDVRVVVPLELQFARSATITG
ncbi:MAG: hypothetical protein JWM95_4452 [Gemmatimonadetes bacterium]|nr:hypothetical protein [Gemmatimonadota bacterium]